jgi:hypothetical protein
VPWIFANISEEVFKGGGWKIIANLERVTAEATKTHGSVEELRKSFLFFERWKRNPELFRIPFR